MREIFKSEQNLIIIQNVVSKVPLQKVTRYSRWEMELSYKKARRRRRRTGTINVCSVAGGRQEAAALQQGEEDSGSAPAVSSFLASEWSKPLKP